MLGCVCEQNELDYPRYWKDEIHVALLHELYGGPRRATGRPCNLLVAQR